MSVFVLLKVPAALTWYKHMVCIALFSLKGGKENATVLTAKMWPVLPGGEPENFGDEAGGQAVDAGLGRRPAQSAVGAAQLGLLLLFAQLPAVQRLQQLHAGRFPGSFVFAFKKLRFSR